MTKQSPNGNENIRISSVHKFVELVCTFRDNWISGSDYFSPWFRGQRKVSWTLQPNIFRYGLFAEEDEIRAEFQRRGPQYLTEIPPVDYWGWYFLMQHYGAPTRLLDWTDSALIALFFALNWSDSQEPEEDAVVWMLDPWWLNRRVLNEDAIMLPDFTSVAPYLAEPFANINDQANTLIKPKDPVAIDPPFIARRVAVQRSHFTIFGHAPNGLETLASEPAARLVRIQIARNKFDRMRADLLTMGISDTSIYPDPKGLSDELIRFYRGTWPPE